MNAAIEQRVFEYNILGLDESNSRNPTLKVIMVAFSDFQRTIDEEIEANLRQRLYGNLSKDEAEKILKNYPTVQEGMKHISGILSEKDYQCNQTRIVNLILEQLAELKKYGGSQRILKFDFKVIKTSLLHSLFQRFGCNLDMELFRSTMPKLKEMGLIPNDLTFEEMAHLCPIGRWF